VPPTPSTDIKVEKYWITDYIPACSPGSTIFLQLKLEGAFPSCELHREQMLFGYSLHSEVKRRR
jgi:hypothetical protein